MDKPDAIIRTGTGFYVRYQGVVSGTRSQTRQSALNHLKKLRAGLVELRAKTEAYPNTDDFIRPDRNK